MKLIKEISLSYNKVWEACLYETENKKNMRGICDYCIIAIYYYHIYEWEKHRGKSRRKKWLY